MIDIIHGDCLTVMRGMEAGSVDAIVTDPPAGIGFMNKDFDKHRGGRDKWVPWLAERLAEAMRVVKPGHYALVWAIPRTSHWTGCAIEDAGWQPIDIISHLFGTGFPKSKARLKPACEFWWLCRAPGGGKVRELGIDACRVGVTPEDATAMERCNTPGSGRFHGRTSQDGAILGKAKGSDVLDTTAGRYPPNLCLTHHPDCVPAGTRRVKGSKGTRGASSRIYGGGKGFTQATGESVGYVGSDGTEEVATWTCVDGCPVKALDEMADNVSRFFPTFAFEAADFVPYGYFSKASKRDRGEGNTHPTVKPQALMRWLCRLICPSGGIILDPFAGSGTTGVACMKEGFHCILIENESDSIPVIRKRIKTQQEITNARDI